MNIFSEPSLPNCASRETEVMVRRTEQPFSDLAVAARAEAEKDPTDPDKWIKLGRLYRRQSMHLEAIAAYSMGITYHPFYPLLYRHKGHAYINISQYEQAAADFEYALRLDPTDYDCWYHLGVSYFLLEDYIRSERCWRKCFELSDAPLDLVSHSDWLWMVLNRLGRGEEAQKLLEPITPDLDPGRCTAYHKRLLMYKGLLKPENLLPGDNLEDSIEVVTMGFGVANYYYVQGQPEKGDCIIRRVLEAGAEHAWSSFGYQAALVEKKRRGL